MGACVSSSAVAAAPPSPQPEAPGPQPESGDADSRRDAQQRARDEALQGSAQPSPGAAKVAGGRAKGEWTIAAGTATSLHSAANPQFAVVLRGADPQTVRVAVAVQWSEAAKAAEVDAVLLAVYRQQGRHPVSRLKALRTEDRVEWVYYRSATATLHLKGLEAGNAYVVVVCVDAEGHGVREVVEAGSFELTVEAEACELWTLPMVPRESPADGNSCKEALAKHAKAQAPSEPEPGSLFVEAPESWAEFLYDTCPVDDMMTALGEGFFVDPEFPPADSSLNQEPDNSKSLDGSGGWARFHEFMSNPQMYQAGVDPDDVIQGQIGNCWFVACLAALGLVPEIAEQLIYPAEYNPKGVYGVRLFWRGAWRWVVVDDWVPMDPNGATAFFIRSRSGNELWMMLLEKAFAKLHSCYQMMRGSYLSNAGRYTAFGGKIVLSMLTGGTTDEETIDKRSGAATFQLAKTLGSDGGLMTLGTRADCDVGGSGLVPNHAYSIVRVCETKHKGVCLMKVRNTWGDSEWKLKWSDADTESWTPPLKAELGFVQANDGMFWMAPDDFVQRFERITRCVLRPEHFPPADVGAARPIITAAAVKPTSSTKNEVPPTMSHRLEVKGRWAKQWCGGLGSKQNPQIMLSSEESGTAAMAVCLSIPTLVQSSSFAAKLQLDVYGVDGGADAGSWISDGVAGYTLLGSDSQTVSHNGARGVYVHIDPATLSGRRCVVVIPQITPAEGEHCPLDAEFVLLVMSSHETAMCKLQPPQPPAPPKLSAAAKVALVQKKQQDVEEARAKARVAFKSYGLQITAAASAAASAAEVIPYKLPSHLTPGRGYPLLEHLQAASTGVKPRCTPGVSLAVSHVVGGLGGDDRNLQLLRDVAGRCFVPANSTVVLAWDFVPGEMSSLGHKEKYRDRIALIDRAKDDDDADEVWSSDISEYAPRDTVCVTLPIELEYGVEYEFRYHTWRADSTFGDFSGARSQPLLVVPRAGVDTDGWISITSSYDEDADGVLHLPRGGDVTVAWDVAELAGITEESREYYLKNGTKNFQDFIAVYPVAVWDVEKYVYYFDVPDDDAQKELALDQYTLETYCSESGVTYVVRYIREKSCMAESAPFRYDGDGAAGDKPANVEGEDKENKEADVEEEEEEAGAPGKTVGAEATAVEFSVDGDASRGFKATWAGIPEASNYDFVAIFAKGDDPYSSSAYYEYNSDGTAAGSLSFAPLEELGVDTSEAGVEYLVTYVSGTTSAAVGPAVPLA